MSILSKVKSFFSRHRNKFIYSGVIITSSILLTRYAQYKLKEWQERETLEFLERNRKQQVFDNISRSCNETILKLSLTLNTVVDKTINTEEIVELIQKNPSNKVELWNRLKVLVFCKAACSIYASVLLVVVLKVQLSLIGGYTYKSPLTADEQERYLSLCQNILDHGFIKLSKLVERVCERILEPVELTKQLKLSDLEAIFWSIQTALATDPHNPIDKLREYTLGDVPVSNGTYENIIRDTMDLLDSDEVKGLSTHCVTRGFMLLGEHISEFYVNEKPPAAATATETEFSNPFVLRKPLAKLLPIINGLLIKKSVPDQFLQQLITYEKFQMLSANVFESLL